MAVCGHCGAETTRVRSRWSEKGVQLEDECPQCSPGSFDKFTAPSEKKIWMGYEVHPEQYVRAEDGGYDRKPEYCREQEEQLAAETADERLMREQIEEHKRKTRRIDPMSAGELESALNKARTIAQAMYDS